MSRIALIPYCLAAALALAGAPARAQEEVLTEPIQPEIVTPDALSLARAAAARGDNAEALSRYLRVLASQPDDVAALVGAGRAALEVGDLNAAAGFLARADTLDPRNGQVKAGLAETMVQNGNARGALRLFNEAVGLGVAPASIAADRGLAYDLRGDQKRAQIEYALALRTAAENETTRRLAVSQAIAGDRVGALATLDPLLRKQDVPAWRTRAFVLALTGTQAEALEAAAAVMPRDQVEALAPYLTRLTALKPAEKAAAIHLGRFPGERRPAAQQVAAATPPPRLAIDRATLAMAPAVEAAPPPITAESAPQPAGPTPAQLAAQARAEARARAAAKAKADEAAREKKEAAEARALAQRNPPRHYVQVAGGANKNDLDREWTKLKAKWPGQLAGRTPWTMHYRFTNRLMIGPFPSAAAAQGWVSDRKAEGFATFRVSTKAGEVVERVD